MFHVFAMVSSVFRRFRKCFRRLFQVFHVFFCLLQLLHLDVSKINQVLHVGCTWEAVDGVGDVRTLRSRSVQQVLQESQLVSLGITKVNDQGQLIAVNLEQAAPN